MSYLAILVASFLATLSLGSPVARQTSLCSFASVPNASNFTLLAVSIADTSVQTPLALGLPTPYSTVPVIGVIVFFGGDFLGDMLTDEPILQSFDSDLIVTQYFDLVNSGINAQAPNSGTVFLSSTVESESGLLSFHPASLSDGPAAEIYCEAVRSKTLISGKVLNLEKCVKLNTDPEGAEYPNSLAVGSDSDDFSLCESSTSDAYVVIYTPASDPGDEWDGCTPVIVHMLPVNQ